MMKRKIALTLALVLLAVGMTGCQKEQTIYQEASGQAPIKQVNPLSDPTNTPVPEDDGVFIDDPYDPASEEDDSIPYVYGVYNEMGESVYAGTTPIPLNPIDMPTPTPRPDLVFNYTAYTATGLGFTFDAPGDWVITQDDSTRFELSDPNVRDNVNAVISIEVESVSNSFKLADVKNDLKKRLTEIQKEYVKWSTAVADARTILGENGYYNTYRGELYDGTVVRGLVHVGLLQGKLVIVHLKAPGWFNSSYTKVYSRLRNSIKEI